jgi:hypothetical protein
MSPGTMAELFRKIIPVDRQILASFDETCRLIGWKVFGGWSHNSNNTISARQRGVCLSRVQ